MKEKEMYYLFKDILINEPKIVADCTKQIYNMELDIDKAFAEKDYFKALMMASNMIEAFLRRFYHYYSTLEKGSALLMEEVDKNNKIPLSYIMDWANGKEVGWKVKFKPFPPKEKIITDKEFELLKHLKNIRNDIAHVYYLNFNENINSEYAKEVIDFVRPTLSKLIGKFVALRKNN